jgi:hypothetical protein
MPARQKHHKIVLAAAGVLLATGAVFAHSAANAAATLTTPVATGTVEAESASCTGTDSVASGGARVVSSGSVTCVVQTGTDASRLIVRGASDWLPAGSTGAQVAASVDGVRAGSAAFATTSYVDRTLAVSVKPGRHTVVLAVSGVENLNFKLDRVSLAGPTITAYVTAYTYFDNTPPGSATISHPVLHTTAGGTGTYADPITIAVGHTLNTGRDVLDYPAGTRMYLPHVKRYFLVEDTCGDGPTPENVPCHKHPATVAAWVDMWLGGAGGTRATTDACAAHVTGNHPVELSPPPGRTVVAGPIFSGGRCTV